MKTIVVALRAFVYMTGFLILWGWVALRVRVFDRNLGISLPAGMKTLGFILLAVGGILALTCAGTFVRWGRGTPAPFDAPREFVAIGPYPVRSQPNVHRGFDSARWFWPLPALSLDSAFVAGAIPPRPSVRRPP
jgi:hypothetical protein